MGAGNSSTPRSFFMTMKNKYTNLALPPELVAIIDFVDKQYPINAAKTAFWKSKLGFTEQHVPVICTPTGALGLFVGSTAEENLIIIQLDYAGVGVLKAGSVIPKADEGSNIENLPKPPTESIITDGMKEALDDFTGGHNPSITTTE